MITRFTERAAVTRSAARASVGRVLVILLSLVVTLAGCSSSSDDFVATGGPGGGGGGPAGNTAAVQFEFDLEEARVEADVTQLRFTGRNADGQVTFGPVTRNKAPRITLENILVSTVRMQIEYLRGSIVTGESLVDLTLTPGTVQIIDNPPITPVQLTEISVQPGQAEVLVGQSQNFSATGTHSNGAIENITGDVVWTAESQGGNANIDANGRASGTAAGDVLIRASFGNVSGTAELTVTSEEPSVTGLNLTADPTTFPVGVTVQLTSTATLSNMTTTDVTADTDYESSDETVATVDENGRVMGVAPGMVSITGTFGDFNAVIELEVVASPLVKITVEPPTAELVVGTNRQFTATGELENGTVMDLTDQVTWGLLPADTTIGDIDESGLFSATAPGGPIDVTATLNDIDGSAQVTVIDVAVESYTLRLKGPEGIDPDNPRIPAGIRVQFETLANLNDGSEPMVVTPDLYTSSNPDVLLELGNGVFLAQQPGEAILLSRTMGSNSEPFQVSVFNSRLDEINVEPETPEDASVIAGNQAQFTAMATFQDLDGGGPDVVVDVTSGQGTLWFVNRVERPNFEFDPEASVDAAGLVTVETTHPTQTIGVLAVLFDPNPNSQVFFMEDQDPLSVTAAQVMSIDILGIGSSDNTGNIPSGYGRIYRAVANYNNGQSVALDGKDTDMNGSADLVPNLTVTSGNADFLILTDTGFGAPFTDRGWFTVLHNGGLNSAGQNGNLQVAFGGAVANLPLNSTNAQLTGMTLAFEEMPDHLFLPQGGFRTLRATGEFGGQSFALPPQRVAFVTGDTPEWGGGQVQFSSNTQLGMFDTAFASPQQGVQIDAEDFYSFVKVGDPIVGSIIGVEIVALTNFRVLPSVVNPLDVGQSVDFRAIVDYVGGQQNVNVTNLVFWNSSGNDIFVNNRTRGDMTIGRASALSSGGASVQAEYWAPFSSPFGPYFGATFVPVN